MSHKMLRQFIVKVSVLGYFPLHGFKTLSILYIVYIIKCMLMLTYGTLLEINGITLIKKWYNPVAPWYTIYGITN